MEVPPRAVPWKRHGKRLLKWLWRRFGLERCFPSLKRGYMGRKRAWRWLLLKEGSWAMKPKIKEVQKSVLWELIINLASMHGEREKGFHSPGKRTARRKGLSLCSSPGEPWDPSFTSPGLGGIINADQSCVPYV